MAFGRAYGDSDFQPRAITEFRKAIEQNPRLPGAHYLLAAVLLATGNDTSPLESAETELKKELAISPDDAMTYAALGKIAVSRNNYPEAETYLKKRDLTHAPGILTPIYIWVRRYFYNTNRFAEAAETAFPAMHPSYDGPFAKSISGPEGALSSGPNPDEEWSAGCRARRNGYLTRFGQQDPGAG